MTEREDKILDYLSEGYSQIEITRMMDINPSNLSKCIQVIGKKLGIVGKVSLISIRNKIMNWRIE